MKRRMKTIGTRRTAASPPWPRCAAPSRCSAPAPPRPRTRRSLPHEQDNTLPPLVPMRRFVANIDAVNGHVLSPDGQATVWVQTVGTDVGLGVRKTADAAEPGSAGTRTFATGTLARPFVSGPTYLLAARQPPHRLPEGLHRRREHADLRARHRNRPAPSPGPSRPGPASARPMLGWGAPGSARFFFANNQRDRSSMDLFEADARTRTVREVARSEPGSRVVGWFIDTQRELAGRMRQLGERRRLRPAAGTAPTRRQLARLQDRAGLRQLLAPAHRPRGGASSGH
jgi:hypothetical protein